MVTDLANYIIRCKKWSPSETSSPTQPSVPKPKYLPYDIPIVEAKELAFEISVDDKGRINIYLDDNIEIGLDDPKVIPRHFEAVPLAVHVTMRPNAGTNEPIPRKENLSKPKLEAEGTPAEEQCCFGWDINTYLFLLLLLPDKFKA